MEAYTGLSILLSIGSVLLTLSMIVLFLAKARKTALLRSFLFYQLMVLLWPLPVLIHNGLDYLGYYGYMLHFFGCQAVENFAICFTGTAWLIFCLFYTNHTLSRNKWIPAMFISVSMACFILSMIKRFNSTISKIRADLFFLTDIILFVLILIGIILLYRHSRNQPRHIKRQVFFLIAGISVPLVMIMVYAYFSMVKGYISIPLPNWIIILFDMTPAGFAFSSAILALATFKYRFLDIVPIALQKALYSMQDCILIVDAYGRIQYCNNTLLRTFYNDSETRHPVTLTDFTDRLKPLITGEEDSIHAVNAIESGFLSGYKGSFSLNRSEKLHFSVKIDPVYWKDNTIVGSVLTLSDITRYKVLLEELEEKYRDIEESNRLLKDYTVIVGELAAAKERNRVARDIHDSQGHTLTLLISLLEVSHIACVSDPELTREKIFQMMDIARSGLQQVRNAISQTAEGKTVSVGVIDRIRILKEIFEHTGVKIEFDVYGEERILSPRHAETIFRICQEGLTNSLRHGKAKNIAISLKFSEEGLKLFIFDNGTGCASIKQGYGLSGMEQRVGELGGTIEYGSDGEKGFHIHIELPYG